MAVRPRLRNGDGDGGKGNGDNHLDRAPRLGGPQSGLLLSGRNDGADGIDLEWLLRAENDPARPVPVITIAHGPGTDVATLVAISKATSGLCCWPRTR